MENVIEMSTGEDELVLIKPTKTKRETLEDKDNIIFTVKIVNGGRHYITNCFALFFGKETSEILSLLCNNF